MLPTNKIREKREQQGLNQSELARRVGTTPSTISRLEAGERKLSQTYMVAIARALGCEPAELIGAGADLTGIRNLIPVLGDCHSQMWSVPIAGMGDRTIPVIPRGKYEKLSHAAYEAKDNSAAEVVGNGGYVIVIPFDSVRRFSLEGDWIVLHSIEGRMERFAIAAANSDQRGSFAIVNGEEVFFDEHNRAAGLVIATYREI